MQAIRQRFPHRRTAPGTEGSVYFFKEALFI
jgi:hypothetical protein